MGIGHKQIETPSEETRKLMIRNEFGGINESFYNLYSITEMNVIAGWRNISTTMT